MGYRYRSRDELTTWRTSLNALLSELGETLVAVAPDEPTLDVEFYPGYGGSEGPPLLAWSENHVFFPVVYDGSEWIDSAPRNPVSKGQSHVGGE